MPSWTLVKIKATGQVIEMLPNVALSLIASGLAECLTPSKVSRFTAIQNELREFTAKYCRFN